MHCEEVGLSIIGMALTPLLALACLLIFVVGEWGRKKRFSVLLVMMLSATGADAQSITVPATVNAMPGLIVIRATAIDADDTTWIDASPGLQIVPPDAVSIKPGVFLGVAVNPGTYTVTVVPAKDVGGKAKIGTPVQVTITVGTPGPPPPAPNSLTATLQAAYAADTTPTVWNKPTDKAALQLLYTWGAYEAQDPKLVTWSDYFAAIETQGKASGADGKLLLVQQAVSAAAVAAIPNSATATNAMTPADRQAAQVFFLKAAQALAGVQR